ncbi:MAG TPA: mercuric reductase [Gemmatimonadaceae bacterium]|nr:mercuric reductase [Gemmatimonadaceae bacterium]
MADLHADLHVDALVIGSGQGGGPLAGAFARAGRRTVLIERRYIGGTCINNGCTPTKTMIASARVGYLAKRANDFGVRCGAVSVDFAAVLARKRAIVTDFRQGSERRLATAGVEVIFGDARFIGERRIEVDLTEGSTRTLSADTIIINVGARPSRPQIPGIEQVPALDSTSIMELERLPTHLVVIGGGYVGVEFAQMFRRFGSRVTIVNRDAQLLTHEDQDVADAVATILREDGIDILLDAQPTLVVPMPNGVRTDVMARGEARRIEASHVLVATGRVPNTDTLHADAAGVDVDGRGYIQVDERLATTASGIYAIGDVKGGPAFTHISYDDFRVLRTNLLQGGAATIAGRLVPYTVFIDPQLGGIGLTEREARAQRRNIAVAMMPMSHVARALEVAEPRGVMKVVVDRDTNRVLGCAVLGLEGGEIMSMLQLAMMGDLPYTALRDGVFAHPTLAESLNNLFAGLTPV